MQVNKIINKFVPDLCQLFDYIQGIIGNSIPFCRPNKWAEVFII